MRLFISYRRGDAAGYAGRLYADLVRRFGRDAVFMDVRDIAAGAAFRAEITTALTQCESVLVVVGRDWLDATSDGTTRRLDRPDDVVRAEVEVALTGDARVVPVLVGGATMPGATDVPESIRRLTELSAFELSHQRWDSDVDDLITQLEPAPTSLGPVRLPVPATALIGRDAQVEALRTHLLKPEQRLITVTGTGGIGKTRVALEAARLAVGDFADGVFFVPLALVSEPDQVLGEIAKLIKVDDRGGGLRAAITDRLRDRRVLLVLDNFEHVLDAATDIALLAADLPQLRVLATSRAPLRIAGEHEFPLDGLDLADAASELFLERARSRRPDLVADPATIVAIAEICRRLDGVPLAIELAAARVHLMSVEEIRSRLDRALTLLTAGNRDAPERQRTLRGTIEWSVNLLSESAQSSLGRLALFVGGLTFAAAAAVGGPTAEDDLEELVTSSLLRRVDHVTGSRFHMLEVVRQYAVEALVPPDQWSVQLAAMRAYFVPVTETVTGKIDGPDGLVALEQLDADYPNLCAIFDEMTTDEADDGARLAVALTPYWLSRGWVAEGRRRLAEVVSAEPSPGQAAAAAVSAGRLAYLHSDFPAATRWLDLAVSAGDVLDTDLATLARCLLAAIAVVSGDDVAAGRAEAAAALALAASREHYTSHVVALSVAAIAAAISGDFAAEKQLYEERLVLVRQHGDRVRTADTLTTLAEIAFDDEDYATAQALVAEGLAIADGVAVPESCDALMLLARIALERGDADLAEVHLAGAFPRAVDVGRSPAIAMCFRISAAASVVRGDMARAAELFGAAMTAAGLVAPTMPGETDIADRVAACRSALGDAEFERRHAAGAALEPGAALDHAAPTPAKV